LYVVVGVSIVTLAADLVNIVYQLLNGIIRSNMGVDILRNSRWSLQTLIVAAPLLWYHWQIVRTDQRRGVEIVAAHKTVTLLAGGTAGELASRIEDKLGFRISVLYRVGQYGEEIATLSDEEIVKLADDIQAAPSTRVMLVALEGRITVFPYRDK